MMRRRLFIVAFMAALISLPVSATAYHDPNKGDQYGKDWHYCNDPAYRDCKGDGNPDNPGEGEHFCKKRAECRHYPPFNSEENARRYDEQDRRGAHSGPCHDQGCQRHCDPQGCWNHESDKRPKENQ